MSFLRDRFIVNSAMEYLYRLPSEIQSSFKPVSLPNCTAYAIQPKDFDPSKTILYLHGGAMCFSMWKFYIPIAHRIATLTRSRVLMPDYRLSPENPYPAAVNDCLDARQWMSAEWDRAGAPPPVVIGDSAGGNLALNVAVQQSVASPMAGLVLMSPWLDLTHSSDYWTSQLRDQVVFPISARRAAWFYVTGADWTFGLSDAKATQVFEEKLKEPGISPLFADMSFGQHCPVLTQVGCDERLYGDALALWNKLGAESPTLDCSDMPPRVSFKHGHHKLSIWSDVPHVWQVTRPWTKAARDAVKEVSDFVNDTHNSKS